MTLYIITNFPLPGKLNIFATLALNMKMIHVMNRFGILEFYDPEILWFWVIMVERCVNPPTSVAEFGRVERMVGLNRMTRRPFGP
jgi:hypothetical protein